MSSKKSGSNRLTIGAVKFERPQRRKRPGRHAKRKRPVNQVFFPSGGKQ